MNSGELKRAKRRVRSAVLERSETPFPPTFARSGRRA